MRCEPHRLVSIDETAATTKMTRVRGRSLRGARLEADALFDHWRTQTFIAGLRIDELSAPWVLDGPMSRFAILLEPMAQFGNLLTLLRFQPPVFETGGRQPQRP